ncbi:MAG TPA: hypothetical protein VFA75_22640 [Nevskia sp.]|nr:hypothetical protein [Nevskia sp.]
MKLSTTLQRIRRAQMDNLLERAIDTVGQIAMYEAGTLDNHLLALRERWSVARRARGVGELLRDQLDLIPATRLRLSEEHAGRLKLWRELASRFEG